MIAARNGKLKCMRTMHIFPIFALDCHDAYNQQCTNAHHAAAVHKGKVLNVPSAPKVFGVHLFLSGF